MTEPNSQTMCPNCQTVVVVEPSWRLVQCSKCGAMITRMGEDSSFD
ncbi:MAG: transposase [Thermoplasmata archaeon]|nr:transposase [Thermoplasmata archaeon]MCI4337434.1 transposase [Thermoplasmata archaeon]